MAVNLYMYNIGIQMKRKEPTKDIYDDFNLKKNFGLLIYIIVFQRSGLL